MMMSFFLSVIFLLICMLLIQHFGQIKMLNRLDAMLDAALANTFTESEFSEKRLSKIETKMYRYLSAGKTSLAQINSEKEAIKSLISDISHQTKTPIANILLYAQLLCDDDGLSENARKLAGHIETQTEKLNFLIRSLIKISRLENGIVSVSPKEHSIEELFRHLDFESRARQKNIELKIENPGNMTALFDFKWTLEAMSNIVDNAIKYTPPGGHVILSAMPYELFVKIDIADDGIGIEEEDFPKIFTRFYRSSMVSDCPGVGIGLYLSREIIAKQGGYVKVVSEKNQGSTFSVFLPKQANMSKL